MVCFLTSKMNNQGNRQNVNNLLLCNILEVKKKKKDIPQKRGSMENITEEYLERTKIIIQTEEDKEQQIEESV